MVICALLRMPYSVQQYVLLKMFHLEQYLYTNLGRLIRGRENLTPVGTHTIQSKCDYLCLAPNALLRVQQYVLLGMPYLEQYLYTKLVRSLWGRENLTPVGVHRIQGKCGYPRLTPNALLRIVVCSAEDALLGIVSIFKTGHIYKGQRFQARKFGYSEQDMRLYRAIRSEAQLSGVPHYEYRHYPDHGVLLRLEQLDEKA